MCFTKVHSKRTRAAIEQENTHRQSGQIVTPIDHRQLVESTCERDIRHQINLQVGAWIESLQRFEKLKTCSPGWGGRKQEGVIMFHLGQTELILILVIVLLLFGAGRIGKIASELGSGIRNFKEGLSGEKERSTAAPDLSGNSDNVCDKKDDIRPCNLKEFFATLVTTPKPARLS